MGALLKFYLWEIENLIISLARQEDATVKGKVPLFTVSHRFIIDTIPEYILRSAL
jgi:hypothetical protein